MTKLEKQAYASMSSIDRCLILMSKLEDYLDFLKVMTKEDIKLIQRFVREEKEK